MTLLRLLALLFLVAPLGARTPAPQEPHPGRIPCPACEGTGRAERDCWACRGEGKHPCLTCTGYRASPTRDRGRVSEALNEALSGSFDNAFADMQKASQKLLEAMGGGKRAPKATDRDPGELACPARCRSGKLLLIEDWIDCKGGPLPRAGARFVARRVRATS